MLKEEEKCDRETHAASALFYTYRYYFADLHVPEVSLSFCVFMLLGLSEPTTSLRMSLPMSEKRRLSEALTLLPRITASAMSAPAVSARSPIQSFQHVRVSSPFHYQHFQRRQCVLVIPWAFFKTFPMYGAWSWPSVGTQTCSLPAIPTCHPSPAEDLSQRNVWGSLVATGKNSRTTFVLPWSIGFARLAKTLVWQVFFPINRWCMLVDTVGSC